MTTPESNREKPKVATGEKPVEAKAKIETQAANKREALQDSVIQNLIGSIDSFKDTPSNPKEAEEYNLRFNRLRVVLLAALEKGESAKSVLETLKKIASKNGNPTSIGLSELQELRDNSIAELNLTPNGKATVENFSTGEKLYEALRKAPAINEKDSPEVKKQKEATVAKLTREYLTSIAENIKAGKYPAGSGDSMVDIMQTVLSDTVGDGKLSLAEFEKIRGEIQSKYENIFEKVDNRKLEDFESLLEKAGESENPEDYLIAKRVEMLEAAKEAQIEAKGNPYNLFTRKYGELKWVVLFAAEKWIYATLGLNLVLNGKNTLTNPAFLGLAAAAGGMYVYKNPEILKGKSDTEVAKEDALTEELKSLREKNPEVANWLGLVDKKDLEEDRPLWKRLKEKKQNGENWIGSKEFGKVLPKTHPSFKEILPGEENPNGRKFYELLVKCQEAKLNPSSLIEEAEKPETKDA